MCVKYKGLTLLLARANADNDRPLILHWRSFICCSSWLTLSLTTVVCPLISFCTWHGTTSLTCCCSAVYKHQTLHCSYSCANHKNGQIYSINQSMAYLVKLVCTNKMVNRWHALMHHCHLTWSAVSAYRRLSDNDNDQSCINSILTLAFLRVLFL